MGGCTSKPKELDVTDPAPADAPTSPNKAEAENVAAAAPRDNSNGGEANQEAPLVDLSEPKPESGDAKEDAKVAEPEPVNSELKTLVQEETTATPAEETKAVVQSEAMNPAAEANKAVPEAAVEKKGDATEPGAV